MALFDVDSCGDGLGRLANKTRVKWVQLLRGSTGVPANDAVKGSTDREANTCYIPEMRRIDRCVF
jgi:hypothetical protein